MDEMDSSKTEYYKKRMSPSLSVPNFNKNNNNSFINKDLKLNMNYYTIKNENDINKYSPNVDYKKRNDELNYITVKLNNLEYKDFIYDEGDDYEKLIMKNKNLKRLFEQVNSQLLKSMKKQQEMEEKYEKEKKMIIEKLSKIQNNYEIYANSHQKLNFFENKIEEISSTYQQLLELYLKTNEKFKEYKNNIDKLYNNISNFVENNYEKKSVNVLSFEFLLHLRNEIKDNFKINDNKFKKQNKTQSKNNNKNEIKDKKDNKYYTYRYYNNNFFQK